MSVALDYFSIDPFPPSIHDVLRGLASNLAPPPHGWWAEPLAFHDFGEEDGRIYGGNKILLFLYYTADGVCCNVDAHDDNLMAFACESTSEKSGPVGFGLGRCDMKTVSN